VNAVRALDAESGSSDAAAASDAAAS